MVYEWEVQTVVSAEDTRPWVNVNIWFVPAPGQRKLVSSMSWLPEEARMKGKEIIEAAEAAEMDASLIMVLRERKTPEEEIHEIVQRIRSRRRRF